MGLIVRRRYRNPTSVPDDVFVKDEPRDYPFDKPGLSDQEKSVLWERGHAIQLRNEKTRWDRIVVAQAEYDGIAASAVQSMQQLAYKLHHNEDELLRRNVVFLAPIFARMTREWMAMMFTETVSRGQMFAPLFTSTFAKGHDPWKANRRASFVDVQREYERRAVAIDQWFAAEAKFAARPEIAGSRGSWSDGKSAVNALVTLRSLLDVLQKAWADKINHGQAIPRHVLYDSARALGQLVGQSGFPDKLGDAVATPFMYYHREVEAGLHAAQKRAAKGIPYSRKAHLAEKYRVEAEKRGEEEYPREYLDRDGLIRRFVRLKPSPMLVEQRRATTSSKWRPKPVHVLSITLDHDGVPWVLNEYGDPYRNHMQQMVRALYKGALQAAGKPVPRENPRRVRRY